ncbi:Urease accessory protein UreD [Streptomyces griseomycini]
MDGVNTAGVRAAARVRACADGRGGTCLPVLEGDGPLALRRTRGSGTEAHVLLVGAMSGPLGGDRLSVRADVRPGARLRIGSAAATLALPGQHEAGARYDVRLTVAGGGELHRLPEQLISVRGSELQITTHADLDHGARLVLREEQVLGRAGEEPGRLTTRLTVRLAGRTVLDQQLACGPRRHRRASGPSPSSRPAAIGAEARTRRPPRTPGVHAVHTASRSAPRRRRPHPVLAPQRLEHHPEGGPAGPWRRRPCGRGRG